MLDELDFPLVETDVDSSTRDYIRLDNWDDVFAFLNITPTKELKIEVLLRKEKERQANYTMDVYKECFHEVLIGFSDHIFFYKEECNVDLTSKNYFTYDFYKKTTEWSEKRGIPLSISDLFCSSKPSIENIMNYYRFIRFNECFNWSQK